MGVRRFRCRGRLDFLAKEKKARLNQFFDRQRLNTMPHELAGFVGLAREEALAVLVSMEAARLCVMKLLIYHCEKRPIAALPYGIGFPDVPWVCPTCDLTVEGLEDLSFDLMAQNITRPHFI